MATVLDRHYTVLNELFAGREVLVISCAWSADPEPPRRSKLDHLVNPQATLWTSMLTNDDPDPDFRTYTHLYIELVGWAVGTLDPLLRAVAKYESGGVMITDPDMSRIYHPYDGGADVLLADAAERDELKARHAAWLSSHPSGL